jgi:hypothetical protein
MYTLSTSKKIVNTPIRSRFLRVAATQHLEAPTIPKYKGFWNPTRYPLIEIHTVVVSAMMLGNPGPDEHDADWAE